MAAPEEQRDQEEHRQAGEHEPEGGIGMVSQAHRIAGVAPEPEHAEDRHQRERGDQRAEAGELAGDFGDDGDDDAGQSGLDGEVKHVAVLTPGRRLMSTRG
jgi:hypothetical protein